MTAGRNRLKRHIAAAKEWLGRAEKSLEQDNAIKGDLHLMLAQAELQRAKETKSGSRRFRWHGCEFVPLAVAVLLVWAGLGLLDFRTVDRPASLQTMAEELPRTAAPRIPAVKPAAPLPGKAAPAIILPQREAPPAAAVKPALAEPAVEPVRQAEPPQALAEPAKVPPVEMQKLMRAAGKTLRAQ